MAGSPRASFRPQPPENGPSLPGWICQQAASEFLQGCPWWPPAPSQLPGTSFPARHAMLHCFSASLPPPVVQLKVWAVEPRLKLCSYRHGAQRCLQFFKRHVQARDAECELRLDLKVQRAARKVQGGPADLKKRYLVLKQVPVLVFVGHRDFQRLDFCPERLLFCLQYRRALRWSCRCKSASTFKLSPWQLFLNSCRTLPESRSSCACSLPASASCSHI